MMLTAALGKVLLVQNMRAAGTTSDLAAVDLAAVDLEASPLCQMSQGFPQSQQETIILGKK